MSNLPDVPGVPKTLDRSIRTVLESLREHVRELRGFGGNADQRAVTNKEYVSGGGGTTIIDPGGPGDGGTPDLTPPPQVTGVELTAGITYLYYKTDAPTFTQGNGYGRTRVYGAKWPDSDPTAPTFSEAVLIDEFVGRVGNTATDPATRWCIWLKWVSRDGVESVDPAGGTNGFQATTGEDVELLLEALTGQITESQLFAALGAKITQIGTIQAQVDSLVGISEYDEDVTYEDGDLVKYLGGLYMAVATTTGNLPTDDDFWTKVGDYESLAGVVAAHTLSIESNTSRITDAEGAISAETSARTLLAAQVGTNTSAIATESSARVSGDAANASSISALTSTVGSNTAAIATEASTRATADGQLFAQYTVKVDTNGYVSGFGLASTAVNAVPYSQFAIRADRFYVASPSGPGITPIIPFVVNTTPVVEAGVTIPAGVYMDGAYIRNLTAMIARFGSASIDNAKIASLDAAKITTGTLDANRIGANSISASKISTASLSALSANLGYVTAGDIHGGRIHGGGITAWSWASATAAGFYLGPEGMLLGRNLSGTYGDTGAWLQMEANGDIYSAQFRIVGGQATLSGAVSIGGASYSAGNGFWAGLDGGVAKMRVGSTAQYLRWTGSALEIKLDTFTASISGGGITGSVGNGNQGYGSRSVSLSGGTAPITYSWNVSGVFGGAPAAVSVYVSSGVNSSTASFAGSATNNQVSAFVECTAVDANGRVARASFNVLVTHGTYIP